jgi:Ca-activated chloride channel family protein
MTLIIGLIGVRENIKWKKVIAPHLRPFVIQKGTDSIKKRLQWILFFVIATAIIGLAGPTWKRIELPGKTLETPLVILLDLSPSMMVTDIQPNRLERAKFKITDFLKENPGARVALIAYSGTAHTVVPLTRDYNIISSHVNSLSPEVMPLAGDNLKAALQLADTVTRLTTAPGTVMLFADDFSENTFGMLQQYVSQGKNKVVIIPMGTPGGAKVPAGKKGQYLKDKDGKPVISSLNTDVIKKLASVDGIDLSTLTLDKSDMELLAKDISSHLEFKEKDDEQEDDWQDEGLLFAIPFALLALFWFRKGWVIYSLVFVMGLTSCSGDAKFKDLWLTRDYQAQQQFDKGEYETAAEMYSDPLHRGVAFYKAGDYEKAIEAFEDDTTATGAYNLGLAYFKNGDYVAAQWAFGQAAELDPEMEEASQNQMLMQQMATETDGQDVEEPTEAEQEQTAENMDNTGGEDLSGGGQEASEEDMKTERKEETAATEMRTGKELEEVPPDFQPGEKDDSQKVLMRKVDDDPALFLKRKFKHQAKEMTTQKDGS